MPKRKSRLTRKEEVRNLKKATFYGGLTFILALGLIFLGIPLLIRLSIFLGNLRSSSLPVESQDILPPSPPTFRPIPEATNSAQIDLHGFAEAGSTVKVFLPGNQEKEVVADKNGSFTLPGLKLNSGTNQIYATAIDESGNTSQESSKLTISFDHTPPELEVSQPAEEESFFGDQNKIKIEGKTESDATIYINNHLAIVGQEGNFSQSLSLKQGENKIIILATDKAGNKTEKEITVNYSR